MRNRLMGVLIAASLALVIAWAAAADPAPAVPAPAVPPASAPAAKPSADGNLLWSDEFDGSALDLTKWDYRQLGRRRDGFNVKEAVTLDGQGHLLITTRKVGDQYHAGMIATHRTFQRTFGYYECRVKFQTQPGHWSAFWLQTPTIGKPVGDPATAGTEIDIYEYLVGRPGKIQHTLHWDGYDKATHKTASKVHEQADLPTGWHTVGLEWTEKEYVFYVDGKETWRTDQAVSRRPQYIILCTELGGWSGDPATAKLPDSVTFDYVRVYKNRPAAKP